MNSTSPTEVELQFFYFGLYRILRRYRFTTILGWLVVLIGAVSTPLGWEFGRPHGLIDLALSTGTIAAGLMLVQQSVSFLDAYVNVPFPTSSDGGWGQSAAIHEITQLMKDIDEGGWQEAYAAIGILKRMEAKHGLPALT
jgi:hypothetical protein